MPGYLSKKSIAQFSHHHIKFLPLLLFVIAFVNISIPIANAQQVMVTPDSYVEDQNGNEITYEEFATKMNTGKFIPSAIKNDDGIRYVMERGYLATLQYSLRYQFQIFK